MSREKLCEHFFEEEHAECIAFKIIEVRLFSFSCKRKRRRRRNEWERCERSNFEVVLAGQGGEGKIVDIVDPTRARYSKTAEEYEFFFQKQVKFQRESVYRFKRKVFLQRRKLITNIIFLSPPIQSSPPSL